MVCISLKAWFRLLALTRFAVKEMEGFVAMEQPEKIVATCDECNTAVPKGIISLATMAKQLPGAYRGADAGHISIIQ